MKWSKKRRAVTRMVAIVTLVFALCWLPITLSIVSANILPDQTALLYYFKFLANSCAYLNSAINPILYAFLNRSFRNNCGSIFSEPSCSLFCDDEIRQSQLKQRPVASTQPDRFSYQSTNRYSASSARDKHKKRVLISDTNYYLSPELFSHNDFSDVNIDMCDTECFDRIRAGNDPAVQRSSTDKTTDGTGARTTSL